MKLQKKLDGDDITVQVDGDLATLIVDMMGKGRVTLSAPMADLAAFFEAAAAMLYAELRGKTKGVPALARRNPRWLW